MALIIKGSVEEVVKDAATDHLSPEAKARYEKAKRMWGGEGKYKKIYAMGEERVKVLQDCLRRGMSPFKLAEYKVQKEWGLCLDSTPYALGRMLDRWRADSIPDTALIVESDPKSVELAKERMDKNVAVMEELSWLIRTQRARIEAGVNLEKTTKMTMNSTTQNVIVMTNLLKNYGELALKVGILQNMAENQANSKTELEHHQAIKLQAEEIDAIGKVFALIEGRTEPECKPIP